MTWIDSEGKKKEIGDKGKSWVEGDMECFHYEKLQDGLTNCNEIYRNPDGNEDTKSEYLYLDSLSLGMYSVVD